MVIHVTIFFIYAFLNIITIMLNRAYEIFIPLYRGIAYFFRKENKTLNFGMS